MSSKTKGTRKALSLKDKMEIINQLKANPSRTALSKSLKIPISTISKIWSSRTKLEEQFQTSRGASKKCRAARYDKVDNALLQWFKLQRSQNIPLSGPLLIEKAKEFSQSIGLEDFKGSTGWLDKWKKRHNIVFRSVSGEAAAVNTTDVSRWMEDKWRVISRDYKPKDIFNCDETGLFWRMLPDKTLSFAGERCSGGKHSKDRLTVLLCCNQEGSEKLKPLVIGKSARPRAFSRLSSIAALPVLYYSNQKAWMTSKLFEEWLRIVDKQMCKQKRKILMLMDNCPSHPHNIKLTNITLVFLPPNTTSIAQPLDQGIIQNFKLHYRGRLLRNVIQKLDAGSVGKVDVLEAIFFIFTAWESVTAETVTNCFRKAGFQSREFNCSTTDDEIVEELSLSLYASLAGVPGSEIVPQNDYLSIDDELLTFSIPTENDIVMSVMSGTEEDEVCLDGNKSEDEDSFPEASPVTNKQALQAIDCLKTWVMCSSGNECALKSLASLEEFCSFVHCASLKQTKIDKYFQTQPVSQ